MATLKSLGLQEPDALNYLISEGLLAVSTDHESYTWSQALYVDHLDAVSVEEVLRTDTCVVWTRQGVVKRVFNLEIEAEQIVHAFATCFQTASSTTKATQSPESARQKHQNEPALVVILKTQAHIFCLSGATHVIPLSFEVRRAYPCLYGCLLQPAASHNPYRLKSGTKSNDQALSNKWANISKSFLGSNLQEGIDRFSNVPKKHTTFCLTDLLSDLGLVAVSHSKRPRDVKQQPLLPADEELIYVSTAAHLRPKPLENICVAVTVNRTTHTITIWHVQHTERPDRFEGSSSEAKDYHQRQSSSHQERSRIASGRGIVNVRDSFGGLMQSFVENEPKQSTSQLSNIEHLAAELGQDFEATGVQTRSARRISSMLARTDLAPASERTIYNEATISSRKSMSRSLRREGSFGSFTDRNSINARRSFPADASILSNNTSFLDAGTRFSMIDAANGEGIDDDRRYHHLDKQLVFVKVKAFACHESSKQGTIDDFKVLLVPHPFRPNLEDTLPMQLSICVQEAIPQAMTVVTLALKSGDLKDLNDPDYKRVSGELKAIQMQKGSSITDACVVNDGDIARLLVLSKTSNGDDVLHLEAPWSTSFRIDLPDTYLMYSPLTYRMRAESDYSDRAGAHRIINGSQVKLVRFLTLFNTSTFVFEDSQKRSHNVRICLQPEASFDRRVLEVCSFVLPTHLQDSMLVAYWEVARWLESQDTLGLERVPLVITLFIMATPFITALQNGPATPSRKKKGTGKRVSSGILADHTNWKLMQSYELTRQSPYWTQSQAWSWMGASNEGAFSPISHLPAMTPSQADRSHGGEYATWLTHCTNLARDFLQSPAGEHMNGPEGYLPTAINQDRNIRRTALATVTVALYLLLEEIRLELPSEKPAIDSIISLRAIIAQLSEWLGWSSWTARLKNDLQYSGSDVDAFDFNNFSIDTLEIPTEPFPLKSIYEFIEDRQRGIPSKYHTLAELLHDLKHLDPQHVILAKSTQLLPLSAQLMAREAQDGSQTVIVDETLRNSMQSVVYGICNDAGRSRDRSRQMELVQKTKAPTTALQMGRHLQLPQQRSNRDVRAMCNQALDAESTGRWDVSSETNQQALTKLLFSHDRRFQEASRLVNQARPPEIEYDPQANWTEADALEAQKLLAQYATRRTFAVVSGRGLMHYNARTPLLTEMVPRAQFSMQCILKPRTETEGMQPMTFSADRTLFTEDKVSWAFFHNGVSAGLMISKSVEFIDTSWILYNKPPELTNRHAGFLLALGLNGHLKSLAKWVAFKYLTPKHTMTSVGLLLGLAASYRGSADTLTTRLLSVHVTCLLPPGAAELNLSPLTQVTGLVGIGLLYHDRQHRRMSEIMISEIESQEPEERSGDESVLRDEGYRLAAGIALGLINLGHGLRLRGLQDMRVVERLLAIAVGPKNVNLVHVLDRATAGAVVAIALVFMKTNDKLIASKIDIPDTSHQFEYVRPDIFLLRTLARHLIMWDNIKPEHVFIEKSLPQQYRHRADLRHLKHLYTNDLAFYHIIAGICFATGLKFAGSQRKDARDILLYYLDQFLRLSRLSSTSYDAKVALNGIRNCLDITALSCATVMAGSGDLEVYRRLRALHGRIDKDTPFGSHLAAHMAIGALFLSGGTATFGTSNIAIASLVIAFYPLFPTDVLDNKGHLQALRHMWVLAVEHRCLYFRDSNNGQIIDDMTVLLKMRDGSETMMKTPGLLPELNQVKSIHVTNEFFWQKDIDLDAKIPASNNQEDSNLSLRDHYRVSSTGITIDLVKRSPYDSNVQDKFLVEIQTQNRSMASPTSGQFGSMQHELTSTGKLGDWIFGLHNFQNLDHAERELVSTGLSGHANHTPVTEKNRSNVFMATTPTDLRLELEQGVLGPEDIPTSMRQLLKQDKLWQIRLLLSWADRLETTAGCNSHNAPYKENLSLDNIERGTSRIRSEVVERLRWRLWRMSVDTSGKEA